MALLCKDMVQHRQPIGSILLEHSLTRQPIGSILLEPFWIILEPVTNGIHPSPSNNRIHRTRILLETT
jgi:hypothetical protein